MKIEIENPGPKISNVEIERLEALIAAKLPADYRRFLLDYNGGQAWPDTIDVVGLPGSPTDINILLGINRDIETSCLSWAINVYSELVTGWGLPIAMDSGGNLFVLILRSDHPGSVKYVDASDSTFHAFELAEGFTEFLQKFREY